MLSYTLDEIFFVLRYPPRSGNYFSTHFIMGGEKFDSPQPESFLFGENTDLNYLGSKPVPFPYPPPQVPSALVLIYTCCCCIDYSEFMYRDDIQL